MPEEFQKNTNGLDECVHGPAATQASYLVLVRVIIISCTVFQRFCEWKVLIHLFLLQTYIIAFFSLQKLQLVWINLLAS